MKVFKQVINVKEGIAYIAGKEVRIPSLNAYVISIKDNNHTQWVCTINQRNKVIAVSNSPACRYLAKMFKDFKLIDKGRG